MASYDSLVSTVLWAIFVIQVIEFSYSNASTNVSTNVICIGAEREALLKFKHGLIDPSRRLLSWTGEECCKWEGVECNKKTGHVLKLDLHNPCIEEIDIDVFVPSDKCMLGGNIVPSLTELKYLKYLDLSTNNFSTQKIPTFFASLQKLEYLNLSDARFNGDIPRQLSNLSKLQYLDLSNNLYTAYFDWVSKLSSLKYLHMSNVDLSRVKDWIGCINMLPSLQSLGLNYCLLQDISSSFQANFTSLRFLSIGGNNLSSIPPWIYNFSKLEHIDLSYDGIKGPFPTAIIENNQRLVFLDMSGNLLRGDFPKNLSSLGKLQSVRLNTNYLNGNISDILGDSLSCVQSKWKIFDVSDNNISSDLPNRFRDLKELEYLDLSWNFIFGSIPANLVELASLRTFGLGNNKVSGTIPESIGQLSNLKQLLLERNFLYGVLSELHFKNLKSLTMLDISSNELILNMSSAWVPPFQVREIDLSDCKVGPKFPKWLQTQGNVTKLRMSNASISDDIPVWLCDIFSNIEVLDISSNMLRGQVPRDIGDKMPQLRKLSLEGNNLTGGIPNSLCKLNRLNETNAFNEYGISLSKNQLSGKLPRCWGALQVLDYLFFGDNKLNGQIPKSLCHLQQSFALSLHRNGFTGEIPNCLSNMPNMRVLDLSDNEFRGRLPPFGPQSPSLVVINLEKNRFVGGIPSQYCQLKYLQFLSLAQNYISGPIPNCIDGILSMVNAAEVYFNMFGIDVMVNTKGTSQIYGITLEYFYSIDLSANMLDGQIPEEFTKLAELQNLNLSKNNLSGYIPSNIGDLKNLESLDLSRNKLSGTIPPGISSIDFLSHLNLSFNRLSGPIPSGNHLHTMDDESIYHGNDRLCGAPLLNTCPGDEPPGRNGRDGDNSGGDKPSEGDLDIRNWFYAGLGPGFIVGFLGFCSVLHFKGSWRVSYFQAMDKAIEKFSMTTMITMLWFKRTFPRHEKELV